jgi:aromatic-L-amino-acid decarboxylase
MNTDEFRKHAHELVDWMADYLENVREYPVRATVVPTEIATRLPNQPPDTGEPFESIMTDFETLIMPGITHWQHPSFHAFFPANSSPPSVLAEMLMATLGAQCMIWQTSPAAAELEEVVMDWLRGMIGLPTEFTGVIQDTASTATLCSILTAREVKTDYGINQHGFDGAAKLTVYCSTETHFSIEKDVKIAGLGADNLRKIPVDSSFAMQPEALLAAIEEDLGAGFVPLCVVATIGTTGSTAIDPLRAIGEICKRYAVWLHVDAAHAGTALLLPEFRWMIDGIEYVDTFVFNPHKWMFTNFDCSAYFVRDEGALVRTFEIMPEYLKTSEKGGVKNFRDWGIPLGRRFRALKLWFVIRTYGMQGLQKLIRKHLGLAAEFLSWVEEAPDFEVLAPVPLNVICFRYKPEGFDEIDQLNEINARLLERINEVGQIYITHTKLRGVYALRMVIAQTQVERADVEKAWKVITDSARDMKKVP